MNSYNLWLQVRIMLTVLHTSQFSIEHSRSTQSVTVFTSHCLVAASNGWWFLFSGFVNCPHPQLPACHSNCSQQLNPSNYPTNSLTQSLTNQLKSTLLPGAFTTMRGTTNTLQPVHLSACNNLELDELSRIWIVGSYTKICQHIPILVKIKDNLYVDLKHLLHILEA
jgi:hypothetical protein